MKRKVLILIGLALFVGAVAFNLQMNSINEQTSNLTLKQLEATAYNLDGEAYCECECDDGNGMCRGYESCDCSQSSWYVVCDNITTYC